AQIRLATPPKKGASTFVVGYGVTETYTDKTPQPYQRYWRDNLAIQGVGPISGYIGEREIYLGESICQGDSGGPVMAHSTGALLAVTSRGGNGVRPSATNPSAACVGTRANNIFTRVDGSKDLIKATLAEYGRIPWEEGAPKPAEPTGPPPPTPGSLGTACTGDGDCSSKICVDIGTGTTLCSAACTAETPCPGGYECAGGYCIPADPPAPGDDAGPVDDSGVPPGEDPTNPADVTTPASKGCSVAALPSNLADGRSGAALLPFALGALLLVARRRRAIK
ncbi:MAG: trypsin-like serine protease, partial [Polyangiales bacterium]